MLDNLTDKEQAMVSATDSFGGHFARELDKARRRIKELEQAEAKVERLERKLVAVNAWASDYEGWTPEAQDEFIAALAREK